MLEEAAAELHDGGQQFPGVLVGGEDLPEAFDPGLLIDQGRSSPAIARLVPKTLYTVAGATPASAAMASIVVAAYPSAENRRRAARAICRRVAAACCFRQGEVTP